jgi:sugar phosphate permease
VSKANHRASELEYGAPDRWFVLTLVALDYFVLILHRKVLGFIKAPLTDELVLSDAQFGWLDTAFIVPYTLSQIFVAYLSDRFQRRNVMLVSLLASVVAVAGMSFASSFALLVVCRALLGFGQAASVPAIAGIMADCFTSKNRSTAVAIYFFSYNAAIMAAASSASRIAEIPAWTVNLFGSPTPIAGWRMALVAFGGLGVIVAAIVAILLREPARTERQEGKGLGTEGGSLTSTLLSVLRTPSYLLLAIIFVLFSAILNARDHWLAAYFEKHPSLDMDLSEAGDFATFWIQPATFAGLLLGGFCADRWARRWRGARSAAQAIGIVAWAPALWIIGTSGSWWLLAGAMVLFGLGLGVYQANLWTTTFEVVDPAARSTAIGLLNVFSVAASISSPLIGYLIDRGAISSIGTALAWLSVLAVVMLLLFIVHIRVTLPRDYIGDASKN